MKITWKLTLFSTFIVSLTTLSMVFVLYETMKKSLIDSHKRHVASIVRMYVRRGMYPGARKMLLIVNGKVLSDPFGIAGKIPYRDGVYEIDGDYYIGVSLRSESRTIFAASYVTPAIKGMQEVSRRLIFFAASGIALSFLASLLMVNFSLSPLRKILKAVKEIDISNLEKRLESSGSGDEFDELVREMNNMLNRIEKAYRAQERFVHDVSHELKNPLSSMKGFIGVLKRWGFSDRKLFDESISEIEKAIDEMSDMIENLLRFSKEEILEKSLVDLKEIALETAKELERKYHNRHVLVQGDARIYTNRDYLRIILRNLLDNALKYSNDDVKVNIKECCLEVVDRGEGIPKEEIDKIFEKFYRIDRSRDRRKEGHGIGLSLVKELSEKMGMRVEVESEPGKGSTFRITWGGRS